MRNKLCIILFCTLFCTEYIQNTSASNHVERGWIEIGDVSMSTYFEGSWHWTTATLYRIDGVPNMAYRVLYNGDYYPVKSQLDEGRIKCSARIPYEGERRWFFFELPIDMPFLTPFP